MNKHKVLGYIFLGVVFAGVVGAIYWWQNVGSVSKQNTTDDEFCIQMIQKARNPQTGEVKEFSTPCDVPAGWENVNEEQTNSQTYRTEYYEFKYPAKLAVSEKSGEVTLNHSIPYENYGCDMKGDAQKQLRLNDFNVSIKHSNKNVADTAKIESSFLSSENFSGTTLKLSPGFIDNFQAGTHQGYSIYVGAEGCGYTVYYLAIDNNNTLVIKKDQVQELSGVLLPEIKEAVLSVPGVISGEEATSIFTQIISSIKFTQ